MYQFKKAQTSTEFLVFLAFVLIISLIILVSFDTSFFIQKSDSAVEQIYFSKQPLAVSGITVNGDNTTFFVQSNFPANITLHEIWLDEVALLVTDVTIAPTQIVPIASTQLNESSSVFRDREVEISINLTVVNSNKSYTLNYAFEKSLIFT